MIWGGVQAVGRGVMFDVVHSVCCSARCYLARVVWHVRYLARKLSNQHVCYSERTSRGTYETTSPPCLLRCSRDYPLRRYRKSCGMSPNFSPEPEAMVKRPSTMHASPGTSPTARARVVPAFAPLPLWDEESVSHMVIAPGSFGSAGGMGVCCCCC